MVNYFDRPIFIVGLPRSGTSTIAGCFQACDVWTGTTIPGSEANPKGFFEHSRIREDIVKRILVHLQCDPLGVRKLPGKDFNFQIPDLRNIIHQIVEEDGYKNDRPWLYKDAKLTLLWPIFAQSFPDANWVIVRRSERDIIDSCLRTSFMKQHSKEPEFWQRFVDEYMQRITMLMNSGAIFHEIWPDTLMQGDFSCFRELLEKLGLSLDEKAMREFISPEFWRT